MTGMTRRALASHLGAPDTTAGIPSARWIRARTFEKLVASDDHVARLVTTTLGDLHLARPVAVGRFDCRGRRETTEQAFADAHVAALRGEASIILQLGLPYPGLGKHGPSTLVLPDFAVVAPRAAGDSIPAGSWLVMGDAKDYERIRSRIDDQRLLKGFLQVAMGAEAAHQSSMLPPGMLVHPSGALAVPRNAFLQPVALVEDLTDHRREVATRSAQRVLDHERAVAAGGHPPLPSMQHLEATFDPASCVSCAMFRYCRQELRARGDDASLLVEIGIPEAHRPALLRAIQDGGVPHTVPASTVRQVTATREGVAQWTGLLRVDPVGEFGTVEVVLAKDDGSALGVHGMAVRRGGDPSAAWSHRVFADAKSPGTRRAVMQAIGERLAPLVADDVRVHLVVPDQVTADLLVSIADSLAGVEVARLRWEHDLAQGREALTFDGRQADIAPALSFEQRLAVSFLLEEDRARSQQMRTPVTVLRSVLVRYLIAGGPASDSGRLDHLVAWAEADRPIDHRALSDTIAALIHTPGARLGNVRSDAILAAVRSVAADPSTLDELVREELAYRTDVVERAVAVVAARPVSVLRDPHLTVEADAQVVWRRRLRFHASDLFRFGRTNAAWRDDHVDILDKDARCAKQLAVLGDPTTAHDLAVNAGDRTVALAEVIDVDPMVRIRVDSRTLGHDSTVVVVMHDGEPCVERVTSTTFKGAFRLAGLAAGTLATDADTAADGALVFDTRSNWHLQVGDRLVVASYDWFSSLTNKANLNVARPDQDTRSSPKLTCTPEAHAEAPEEHQWCCRPHEDIEAGISDWLADRRDLGELHPEVWPPVRDPDGFDVKDGRVAADDVVLADEDVPEGVTLDDLD